MPKQKMKVVQAGRFVRVVLYTPTYPSDSDRARAERQRITTEARRRINLRYSWQRLHLLIEANFGPGDTFVTLTYDDDHLPHNREEARRRIKAFIRKLRQVRQAEGKDLRYLYCIESRHGEGRLHHHLLLNIDRAYLPLLCQIWKYGTDADVHMETFDAWGAKELAQYMTKEPRNGKIAESGARAWAGSRNLQKPVVYPTRWVDANVRLDVPLNAHILLNEGKQNEWGGFGYLEYYLPEDPPQTRTRPRNKSK